MYQYLFILGFYTAYLLIISIWEVPLSSSLCLLEVLYQFTKLSLLLVFILVIAFGGI